MTPPNDSARKSPHILVCGPNPSWQKTLVFDEFRPCEVNRAKALDCRASGKGVNFARAIRTWGTARPVVFQFSGGANGRDLDAWLRQEGIESVSREIEGETRCCKAGWRSPEAGGCPGGLPGIGSSRISG